MVLGDNIFAGHGLKKRLIAAVENAESGKGATVFGYYVDDPERFGIVEFDKNGKATRPFNSRLDKSKLVEAGFTPLPTWQDALSRYLKEIEQ